MKDNFFSVFGLIYDVSYSMLDSFNDILINNSLVDLKTVDFKLILFSDTPIIEFVLYDLLIIILMILISFMIYKIIMAIFKIPINFIRKGW